MTQHEDQLLEQLLKKQEAHKRHAENEMALKVFGFVLVLIVMLQVLAAWASS